MTSNEAPVPKAPVPPVVAEITRQVPLAYTVPGLQRVKIAELCPLHGKITSVTISFPDGCNNLVHVAFGHSEVWVIPSEINTFISLNDTTPVFPFPAGEPVKKNEYLWAELRNGDIIQHSISVIATIEGRAD